jgi:hypothetical protein
MTNQEIINEICADFARELMVSLQQSASSKVGKDTGGGGASFDTDFVKGAASAAAVIVTEFQSHMRLYDMRKVVRRSGLDPRGLSAIKDWIERKGISSFLSKYKGPTQVRKAGAIVPVPVTRIINNIAWGISVKKKPLKRKKWYNTKKGGSIYTLYARLVDGVIENSLKEVKENVERG